MILEICSIQFYFGKEDLNLGKVHGIVPDLLMDILHGILKQPIVVMFSCWDLKRIDRKLSAEFWLGRRLT